MTTQLRAFGAFSGPEYGDFGRGGRDVPPLTTGRAFGSFSGQRYGGFDGKRSGRPVGVLTQWHAYGTGRRYGDFAKAPSVHPPAPAPTQSIATKPYKIRVPEYLRRQQIDEEEIIFALIAATIQSGILEPH